MPQPGTQKERQLFMKDSFQGAGPAGVSQPPRITISNTSAAGISRAWHLKCLWQAMGFQRVQLISGCSPCCWRAAAQGQPCCSPPGAEQRAKPLPGFRVRSSLSVFVKSEFLLYCAVENGPAKLKSSSAGLWHGGTRKDGFKGKSQIKHLALFIPFSFFGNDSFSRFDSDMHDCC